MMRFFLAMLALMIAAPAYAHGDPFWMKRWQFGELLGSPRAIASMKGIPTEYLELRRDRVDHPLISGVCANKVDYSDLKHRTRAALAKRVGAFWRFPAAVERPGSVSGWIGCNRANVAAVAFVNPRLGYLFFEDGLVITLH